MKKLGICLLFLFLTQCSDGDLQIETLDFDSSAIAFCGSVTTGTEVFFKLNATEAIILQLQSGVLKNEASDGTISSSIPGNSQLIYRDFDENVTNGYFCDDIPPSTPKVLEEIEASAGNVLITTTVNPNDPAKFDHLIELSGITLLNSDGERITDLRINNFGTVTTSQ